MVDSMIREPIRTPSAWRGPSLAEEPGRWIHSFEPRDVEEIVAAVRSARATGKPLRSLTREDFPLPELSRSVLRWGREIDRGLGFVLLRGFPVERLGDDDAGLAYYGLGLHLGTPVSQNAAGDLLGHVTDHGDAAAPARKVRLYRTREKQDFHTDGADVIGLLCLRPARSGGLSRIVSSHALYNEILERRPDLLPALYQPMHFDRNDEQGPGETPYFTVPICHLHQGRLRVFYIGWYIRDAQRHPGVPPLTAPQRDLLDLIESIANDPAFYLDMDFVPGDIQLLNNASILHARTAYEDYAEPSRKRHLLRLWLTPRDFSSVEELLASGVPQTLP